MSGAGCVPAAPGRDVGASPEPKTETLQARIRNHLRNWGDGGMEIVGHKLLREAVGALDRLQRDADGYEEIATQLSRAAERRNDACEVLLARIAALETALNEVMVGGNHLACWIGADHPPPTADVHETLEHYGAGIHFDVWCGWRSIMLARDVLEGSTSEAPPSQPALQEQNNPAPEGL